MGASAAAFAAWRGRIRPWVCGVLLLIALAWPWPVAIHFGLDHYTMTAAFYISFWTAAAVAVGTVWGLVSRLVLSRTALFAVALLPALAGAAFLLERQRVPDAPCAERALFQIGGLTIAIPSSMGARSVVTGGAPPQAWQGRYSDGPGDKPEVSAFCKATGNGREAVQVSHLWFPVSWFRKLHETECAAGTEPDDLRGYCAAIARTRLTVVQFYARPDGMPDPSLSHFNPEPVIRARAAGETAGYRCNPPTPGPKIRYCTIWLQLTPEVLAVSSAQLGVAANDDDPVADAAVVLETLVSSLRSEKID